jgi:peptidyl-prolyl cis-trans isomerase SurA
VIDEIAQNRRVIAQSFYYDKHLTQKYIDEMLPRRKEEYKIAIVVVTKPMVETEEVTKESKRKLAEEALSAIKAGTDFAAVAEKYSEDTHNAGKGGVLPNYLTAGKIQKPIEDAVYVTKVGDVYPQLVETEYGYFIIKVLDKKKREFVKAAHILFKNPPAKGITDEEKDSLKKEQLKKANEVLAKIKKGEKFERLAELYSEDALSAPNGGSLKQFYSRSTGFEETGRALLPEFEEAMFKLKDGEISGLVETDYGIHIVKREASKQIDENEDRETLKKFYKKHFYNDDKNDLDHKLMQKHKLMVYKAVIENVLSYTEQGKTTLTKDWESKIPDNLKQATMYSLYGKDYKVSDFITEVNTNPQYKGTSFDYNAFIKVIEKMHYNEVFDKETENIEKEEPEFAASFKEYKNGILLFKVQEEEVWNKMKFDSTQAKIYWEKRKNEFLTDTLYEVSEIYIIGSDSVAMSIYNTLTPDNFKKIASEKTERQGMREKEGFVGVVSAKNSLLIRNLLASETFVKEGIITKPFRHEAGKSIVYVQRIVLPRIKTFEEAIPNFSSDYQEEVQQKLLDTWIEKLRKKYDISVSDSAINEILKKSK